MAYLQITYELCIEAYLA